ncbi:MAG: AbrB/MazE/SpoVT family DNA-binding domain-containing protein [Candidatus Limnocylindrales bacterium]
MPPAACSGLVVTGLPGPTAGSRIRASGARAALGDGGHDRAADHGAGLAAVGTTGSSRTAPVGRVDAGELIGLALPIMLSVKVSTKHQIVVPSEVRSRLGIVAGDRLEVIITDDAIVMRKRPARPSDRLRGLGAGKGWYEPDPDTYLRQLRDEWEDRGREREGRIDPGPGAAAPAGRDRQQRPDLPAGRGSRPG